MMLAKKADIDRIYLPYPEGGRGFMNLEDECKTTIIGFSKLMIETDDPQVPALLKHQTSKALCSIPKEAKKYLLQVGTLEDLQVTQPRTATRKAKKLKDRYKRDHKKLMRERYSQKPIHGKIPTLLEKEYIDTEQSFH